MLTCSFCVLLHVSVNASFCTCRFCLLQALNTEILPFWWLLGNISNVIILWLLPYYLFTKVALQNNTQISLGLSVSGGWLFDWQLVNDAISILLGKWSSGHSQLVCAGGGGVEALSMMDGWASPATRSCPTVLLGERLSRREAESEDEVVWQTSPCGRLFMACTRWLVGHYLCCQTLTERVMSCCGKDWGARGEV